MSHNSNLEQAIVHAGSWQEIENLLSQANIPLTASHFAIFSELRENGLENQDHLIDQIPCPFIMKETGIQVQLSLLKSVFFTNEMLSAIRKLTK